MRQTDTAVTTSLSAAIVIGFVAVALFLSTGCKSDTRKESATVAPIKNSTVDFPGMQLRPGNENGSFTLVGRARNRSAQQTVSEIKLRLTMEDVLTSGATTTVGEAFVLLQQELPPGESKSFSEKVAFKKLPSPRGRLEWNYSIVGMSVKE